MTTETTIIPKPTHWGNDLPDYLLEAIAEYGSAMCTLGESNPKDFELAMTDGLEARRILEESIRQYRNALEEYEIF